MQKITTHPFRLEKARYFSLLLQLYARRKWYLIVLIIGVLALYIPKASSDSVAGVFVLFGLLYFPLIIFRFYRWVYSKENANYFIESQLTVEDSFLYFKDINGNESKINTSSFVKVGQTEKEYLLYVSQNNFSYIPKAAFKTDEDREHFEKTLNITS
ncbi:YcxB family protein [Dokdonia sp.]|uniref:YcxB family protein n=1 Tax=Dokdonia sp. TaxID=2024995 RepID=UPI003263BE88